MIRVGGIFLLRPELRDRWDLRMVVTAAFDVRLRREPGQELYRAEAQPEAVADVINDDPAAPLLQPARA